MYPVGGATSLTYGLPPRRPGLALQVGQLERVIDYPARDMTITVEAGMTLAALAAVLAQENQQLPLDVPLAEHATVGGVLATDFNGPRRTGWGAVRDFVIGIQAVDGRGVVFHGGGRVVKNVAGYDFCKLLTGSLGTLAVITQVTLKLKPLNQHAAWVLTHPASLEQADQLLAELIHSPIDAKAVELLAGVKQPPWDSADGNHDQQLALAIFLEGTEPEINWMADQLRDAWAAQQIRVEVLRETPACRAALQTLAEFPQQTAAPLVVRGQVVPSGVVPLIAAMRALDPQVEVLAHAADGTVIARFPELPAGGVSHSLLSAVTGVASRYHGGLVVLSCSSPDELTRPATWGQVRNPTAVLTRVKEQFDPENILNPGRFIFA